jgi:tetratricopeptide (TPR) repeat protein
MLTGRQKNDFKIILILLALSTVLAVPILAKQQRSNGSKPTNSRSVEDQQVTTINVQRPLNAIIAPTKITPITRLSRPQNISGISRNTGLNSIDRATKFNISQPGRLVPSRQTNGAILGSGPILQLQSSIGVRAHAIKMPTGVSSSIVTRNPVLRKVEGNVSPDNNRNSDKTSRISSPITTARPSISTPLTQFRPALSKSEGTGILQSPATNTDSRTHLGEVPNRSQINSIRTSRIGSFIAKQRPSNSIVSRQPSVEPRATESQTKHRISSGLFRVLGAIGKKPTGNGMEAERTHKNINLRVVDNLRASSAIRNPIARPEASRQDAGVKNRTDIWLPYKAHSEHRPASIDIHRYEHVYWDHHNQLCHRIIWPKYRFAVYYNYGPYFTFGYVYPYYLRRYIFVSLGGYWPMDYCYLRYYWYGCHPYQWYGYYPIAREVMGDTYNYYTYNYYYGGNGTVSSVSSQEVDGIKPVDHNTFADVREKLAQQANKEPAAETEADVQFDEAVKAFEAGDYETAIENFAEAGKLAPDDMVLPFAYSQALFANEQYAEAAEVLRTALAKVSPEKEGVFYPRGLYSDDKILFEQIEHLRKKAESYSFDADLQLLLGYQLLGIGEIDKAVEPLQQANQDMENATSATILLNLVAKMKTDSSATGNNIESNN